MITDEILLNAGYKQFKPITEFYHDSDVGFQKRFDDEVGKKYFITCIKYPEWYHPYTNESFPPSYEFEIQFTDKETGCPVNVLLFAGWPDIESVEKRAEDFWNMGCWKYYERFE